MSQNRSRLANNDSFIVVCRTQGLELNIVHLPKYFIVPYVELNRLWYKEKSHVLWLRVQIMSGLVD